MAANDQPQVVGPGQLRRVDRRPGLRIGEDRHKVGALIILLQARADLFRGGRGGQQLIVEHDRRRHPLVVVIDDREKDRRIPEPADLLHLRQVLVVQVETVDPGRAQGLSPARRLIVGDHLFAAA